MFTSIDLALRRVTAMYREMNEYLWEKRKVRKEEREEVREREREGETKEKENT